MRLDAFGELVGDGHREAEFELAGFVQEPATTALRMAAMEHTATLMPPGFAAAGLAGVEVCRLARRILMASPRRLVPMRMGWSNT